MWARLVLTFDVMPQNGSVVVLPSLDGEGGGGVGLPTLVPCDHLDLPPIPVLAFRDVKMPHSITTWSLKIFNSIKKSKFRYH